MSLAVTGETTNWLRITSKSATMLLSLEARHSPAPGLAPPPGANVIDIAQNPLQMPSSS